MPSACRSNSAVHIGVGAGWAICNRVHFVFEHANPPIDVFRSRVLVRVPGDARTFEEVANLSRGQPAQPRCKKLTSLFGDASISKAGATARPGVHRNGA